MHSGTIEENLLFSSFWNARRRRECNVVLKYNSTYSKMNWVHIIRCSCIKDLSRFYKQTRTAAEIRCALSKIMKHWHSKPQVCWELYRLQLRRELMFLDTYILHNSSSPAEKQASPTPSRGTPAVGTSFWFDETIAIDARVTHDSRPCVLPIKARLYYIMGGSTSQTYNYRRFSTLLYRYRYRRKVEFALRE